jgi:hypothetical protein
MSTLKDWYTCAMSPATVRRALASALLVGPVLVAINHGDAILDGDVTAGRVLKMTLTLVVPYAVSTFSSVQSALAYQSGEQSDLRTDASHASRVGYSSRNWLR